jgi:hypothetical protein
MKLLLTLLLVLTVAVVPALAQDKSPTVRPGASGGGATGGDATAPKPDSATPSTSPAAPSASPAAPSASPAMGAAPATTEDCAKGGWAKYTDKKFKSEAECVASLGKTSK